MTDTIRQGNALSDKKDTGSHRGSFNSYTLTWLLLFVSVGAVTALLALPLRAPIGAMYWDTFIYYDAANRILGGQVPVRDFFIPAGPLGYAVAALWVWAFPNGQPTLLLHWSIMTVSLPLMAFALLGIPREDRHLAVWLVLPFLLFTLLPFNGKEYYPFPGSDGFAYYNRQTCILLFPLIAGLIFGRSKPLLIVMVVASMLALFFLKITGFVAAGLICLFALIAGRLHFKDAVAAALCFLAFLGAIEISSGLVSGYVSDILLLVGMNSGTLLPRVLQALSINFGLVAALGLLILLLAWADRFTIRNSFAQLTRERSFSALSNVADRPIFWIVIIATAGIAFETQNTASQAMIFVWPVLLWIVREQLAAGSDNSKSIAVLALVGAVYLPLVINIVERTARAYIGTVGNVGLLHKHLGTLGSVSARPNVIVRAETMAAIYARHGAVFKDVAERGEMPSVLLYSDFDFQIMHLKSIDQGIEAILLLEAQRGARFETIMALDFTNPFPWLMGRRAPAFITIGADPFRAVPPLNDAANKAVSAVDIALLPTCPPTPANAKLNSHFAAPLHQHRRMRLTPCFDAYLHPRFE